MTEKLPHGQALAEAARARQNRQRSETAKRQRALNRHPEYAQAPAS